VQVVRVAKEMKLVKLDRIGLDGTYIDRVELPPLCLALCAYMPTSLSTSRSVTNSLTTTPS